MNHLKEYVRSILEVSGYQNILYHGSPLKIDRFNLNHVGQEEANDQEGPGIYLSTMLNDARGYAGQNGFLHRVEAKDMNLIQGDKPNMIHVKKLILQSLGWIDEEGYANWGENPEVALQAALKSIQDYSSSAIDGFQSVWASFYRYDPKEYIRNMVQLGYDGFLIPKEGGFHLIAYNPNKLRITRRSRVKSK